MDDFLVELQYIFLQNDLNEFTLYKKEGKEIFVSDIQLSNLRPVISFKKKLFVSLL